MAEDIYPNGAGALPGARSRRRGALPGAGGGGEDGGTPPIGSSSFDPAPDPASDPASDPAGLNVTERPQVPGSKMWGLRVSEDHYNTGNMIVNVLATQFRLDKRQVGELIVQYLVRDRFDLFDYVQRTVGEPAVDLDFFTRKAD